MSGSATKNRRDSTTDTTPTSSEQTDQRPPRPPPRASSPAKRSAADMEDAGNQQMDVDSPTTSGEKRRNSGQGSPRHGKPLPTRPGTGERQQSTRSTSVEMVDQDANAESAAGSDTTSNSNHESAATSLSTASDSPSTKPLGSTAAESERPSVDDQVKKVMTLYHRELQDGQEGYIVSERWLERVFSRTTENNPHPEQFDKSATEGEIGPVDNSGLVDETIAGDDLEDEHGREFLPLKPGLGMGQDFEVLPADAWQLIIQWYGMKEGTPAIPRYVHNTAPQGATSTNLVYDLYPLILTIRKLRNDSAGLSTQTLQDQSKLGGRIVASRSELYKKFLTRAKNKVGIDIKNKVQVWRVLATGTGATQTPSGMLTPESSPRAGSPAPGQSQQRPPLLIDVAGFTSLTEGTEREMVTGKDETANEKYNGHMDLQTAAITENQVLILEEQIGGPGGGEYVSDTTRKVAEKNGVSLANGKTGAKRLQGTSGSGRSSPIGSGPVTRGRTQRNGRTKGTVGLTNLGNTCYMNSALQCIRSVEELTLYFLQGQYKDDLNPSNPLGHGGSIAKAYAGLLGAVYDENSVSSFSPKNFKNALGRAQPLFSGYGQQDSQEFLSFLVDGLHEDLNRILKKPYVENPESDDNTVNDPEAIKALGEKFRQIHHARNDSVATDLFNGFYKNTMICPACDKVSITFDPFSLLTLQLPIEQTWQHTVGFLPLYGKPIQIEVDIDKNATVRSLKEYIAKRIPGLQWNRLMGAEIYSHKFYRTLEDSKSIAECNIQARDDILFYELEGVPTNFPPPKKKQKVKSMINWNNASSDEDVPESDSPLAERMVVPIFHRAQNVNSYSSNTWSLRLWPSYILLTREEAKDYDSILRKVLTRVGAMTTRDIFSEAEGSYGSLDQSRNGSDTVLTTEEDASNIDPQVQDESVEGEDNMVEVTMTDAAPKTTGESQGDSSAEKHQRVPEVLRPGSFIPPEFRRLFEIKYNKSGKEFVPTGWSSIDQNKNYNTIQSRIRIPPSPTPSAPSNEDNSNSSEEDAEDTAQFSASAQESIAMAEQSSEDELPAIEPNLNRSGRGKNHPKGKRGKKKMKTYGKKGKGRFREQHTSKSSPEREPEADDNPYLVRLGEALILDWESSAYEALFDGRNESDSRGRDSLKVMDTLEDPELAEKKARRSQRRQHGITLEDCFQETSKSEILSEENAWYCNRCKELRRASKTLEIWTAPDILVIHLKRFSAHRGFRDKVDVLVDFPVEGLDLTGRVGLPEGKELIYDLFAVDNHYGGLGGGHYTAYAQNFFDKRWYDYNDSSVSRKADPSNVVTTAAYLLFYRRRSSHPLGPPYLQKIVEAAYNPPDSEDADNDNDHLAPNSTANSRNPSRSPGGSGNGSRLDASSRNGSSNGAVGAVAGVLRGGAGSGLGGVGNLVKRGVGAAEENEEETDIEADVLPGYPGDAEVDEGYADDGEGDGAFDLDAFSAGGMEGGIEGVYAPLNQYRGEDPGWDFNGLSGVAQGADDNDSDFVDADVDADADAASDAPQLGSETGMEDQQIRLLEDFGPDEGYPSAPGMNSPAVVGEEDDEDMPSLVGEVGLEGMVVERPVAEVRLDEEVEGGRVKVE